MFEYYTSLDNTTTDEVDGGVPDVDKVNMTVTTFQLAIIAKQSGIVKVFLFC